MRRRVWEPDYYCPSFYGKSAADLVFQQLETQLSPFFSRCQQTVTLAGRVQPIPRRHAAFGDPGLSYSFSGITMRANPLVSSLRDHVQWALGGGERFNFVLVNRYKDGLDHIGEHRDSERDLEPTAPIASLSFGQLRDFVLRRNSRGGRGGGRGRRTREGELVKLELGHGSLLVMCHPTNSLSACPQEGPPSEDQPHLLHRQQQQFTLSTLLEVIHLPLLCMFWNNVR